MNDSNAQKLGGRFTFPGTSLTVHRMGYGAMQLAGPQVWGPPRDSAAAAAVLREAIALGIDHIGLSNVTARQVEQARALTEIVCVQNHYNLAHRQDDALIDALAKEGIAYV